MGRTNVGRKGLFCGRAGRVGRSLGLLLVAAGAASCSEEPEHLLTTQQALCNTESFTAGATTPVAEVQPSAERFIVPSSFGSNYQAVPPPANPDPSVALLTLRGNGEAVSCWYDFDGSRYQFDQCDPIDFEDGDIVETKVVELELLSVDIAGREVTAVLTDDGPEAGCALSPGGCRPQVGSACAAPDACSSNGICSEAGTCLPGDPITPTPDSDPCTIDWCDPATGEVTTSCSGVSPETTTTIGAATAFLYTGPGAVQSGVTATIPGDTASVVTGYIEDRQDNPLAGVEVSVVGHPELGVTVTDAFGEFAIAVFGGGPLTFAFKEAGYLPAQRRVDVPWQDYAYAGEIVLTELDANATPVDFTDLPEVVVGTETDELGFERTAVLFIPDGISAEMRLPGGSSAPVSELTLRVTEYTVGDKGPASMPGPLPVASGYTYAVELSADEAIAAGAISVEFSAPTYFYLENFLDFPVGTPVPAGYYDYEQAAWIPSENGIVIEFLSVEIGTGYAEIDLEDDGVSSAATQQQLDDAGFTNAERLEIANRYTPGQTLWRTPIRHLTPWDCNWPYGPGDDDCTPFSGGECESGGGGSGGSGGGGAGGGGAGGGGAGGTGGGGGSDNDPEEEENEDDTCDEEGSIIECHNQTLGKELPIAGTPYSLHYRSDRVPGRISAYDVSIPVSGPSLPDSLLGIDVEVRVGGKTYTKSLECSQANPCPLDHEFHFGESAAFGWDGADVFGRVLQGKQPVAVNLFYRYPAVYREPADFDTSFGALGGALFQAIEARQQYRVGRPTWRGSIGTWSARGQADLGGFTVNVHHGYDLVDGTLYLGTGERRRAREAVPIIETVGGGLTTSGNALQEGQPVMGTSMAAFLLETSPDGSYVFMDTPQTDRIWRALPDGTAQQVAGCLPGPTCAEGDVGDPAIGSELVSVANIGVDPDGVVHWSDRIYQGSGGTDRAVYKVSDEGTIALVAGGSATPPYAADGDPAFPSYLGAIEGFDFSADGGLYVVGGGGTVVYRVEAGRVYRFAGTPQAGGTSGDGGSARDALLQSVRDVVVGSDGTVNIVERCRVRRVTMDGTIDTIAGQTSCGAPTGDGGLATAAQFADFVQADISDDGTLYLSCSGSGSDGHVRLVDRYGIVHPVTAYQHDPMCTTNTLCGDRGPALAASVPYDPWSIAVQPNGDLLVALHTHIARIGSPYPGLGGSLIVPDRDGHEGYVFDTAGRHLETRDLMTGATIFSFDYTGTSLTSIADRHGNVTTIDRNRTTGTIEIERPIDQEITTLELDIEGWVNTITNPANEIVEVVMSADGLLTEWRSAENEVTSYSYEPSTGRLIGKVAPAPFNGIDAQLALSRTEIPNGWQVTFTDEEEVETTYEVTRNPDGSETRTTYFPHNLVAQTTRGLDDSRTTYLADGTTITQVLGPDPRFGMLAPIVLEQVTQSPGTPPIVKTIRRARNIVTAAGDPFDVTSWTESYTEVGGGVSNTFTTTYNPTTRVLTRTSPAGNIQTTTYDVLGRPTIQVVGSDLPMHLSYNNAGQLVQATRMNGTTVLRPTDFGYIDPSTMSASPFLASVQDALSQITTINNDLVGRAELVTRPDNESIALAYDDNGSLTDVTPAGKPVHELEYDSRGLLSEYSPPDLDRGATNQFATTYAYNADRQIKDIFQPGRTISYTYDDGRLDFFTIPGATIDIGYSTTGKRNWYSGPDSINLTFGYDGRYQTSALWSGGVAIELTRQFDDFARLWKEQLGPPAGSTTDVVHTYDADGLLDTLHVDGTQYMLDYGRADTSGRITAAEVGFLQEDWTPNAYGELALYTVVFDNSVDPAVDLYELELSYDALGRIATKKETILGTATTRKYQYDPAGRLWKVLDVSDTLLSEYLYDENGNRKQETLSMTLGEYDDQDRIEEWGLFDFTHTNAGEIATKSDGTTTLSYDYDALGNLLSVTDGTDIWTYEYDGMGRQTTRSEAALTDPPTTPTHLHGLVWRSKLQPIAKLAPNDGIQQLYVHGPGVNVPELIVEGSNVYRVVKDHLGSVRLIVRVDTGAVIQQMEHDEWGVVTFDDNPGWQPFGFAGGLYDPDTELVRFGARDYDPTIGRWLAKDPLQFAAWDTNLYRYAFANPTTLTDASGRWVAAAGAILAGAGLFAIALDVYYLPSEDAEESGLPGSVDGPQDAYRHCLALCVATGHYGRFFASTLEAVRGEHQEMDIHNNEIGKACGERVVDDAIFECRDMCRDALDSGELQVLPEEKWLD